MHDYISEDAAAWHRNFRVNSKLKTANKTVRNLYDVILQGEYRDSDHWYFGGGADELVHYLSWFDDQDMQDLRADLLGWTTLQQDILADCLIYGRIDWPGHRQSKAFAYQSDLLLYLFSVTEDTDIRIKIFEGAAIILDGRSKPCDLLLQVKDWADALRQHRQAGEPVYQPLPIHYELIETALQKAGGQYLPAIRRAFRLCLFDLSRQAAANPAAFYIGDLINANPVFTNQNRSFIGYTLYGGNPGTAFSRPHHYKQSPL